MNAVTVIPAFGDNFIYVCRYAGEGALAVDPCDSSTVLRAISDKKLQLTDVLVTHHHRDHTAGVAELKKMTGCRVIGSDKQRIPGIDEIAEDGQILTIGDIKIQTIATPGHTRTAVCYYLLPLNEKDTGILWTGDTLFIGGCGRLLECNARVMWNSLQKLAALPDRTNIYCGHDYTLENYEFALEIEPHNQAVKNRLNEIKQKQQHGEFSVPSTMSQEKETNIFLRACTPEIKNALNMPQAGNVETFAELRRRKDIF